MRIFSKSLVIAQLPGVLFRTTIEFHTAVNSISASASLALRLPLEYEY